MNIDSNKNYIFKYCYYSLGLDFHIDKRGKKKSKNLILLYKLLIHYIFMIYYTIVI
jgi:hypothetical protein